MKILLRAILAFLIFSAAFMNFGCNSDKCSANISELRVTHDRMSLVFGENGNAGRLEFSRIEQEVQYRSGNEKGLLAFSSITGVHTVACVGGRQRIEIRYYLDKSKKEGSVQFGAVTDDEWARIRSWLQNHLPREK